MKFPGFIGPSYTLGSVTQDCQRTRNLYAEVDETGSGADGEIAALVGRPGLKLRYDCGTKQTRGGYTTSLSRSFFVAGSTLYEDTGSATVIGTINSSSGVVSMADNGLQLMLVDGQDGWILTLETNAFVQITDQDFPIASKVIFQDGYFLVNEVGTRNFWISTLEDGSTWDGLDFAVKEGQADLLLTIETDHEQIILGGTKTIEFWMNTGDADFPFTRVTGGIAECGIAAAHTLRKLDNSLYWLGADSDGGGIAYKVQGYTPNRISTHAIEQAIKGYGDISATTAWTFQIGGNKFWILNFAAGATWAYNVASGSWTEWTSTTARGEQTRFRADWHMMVGTKHVVGDFENGLVYELDEATYTDNGTRILFERTCPHFSKNRKRLRINSLEIGMETGIGIDGIGQGSDPVGYLTWSKDHGHTWATPIETSLGKLGEYLKRVKFDRLGTSVDWVIRFYNSEPIKQRWVSAEIDVVKGRS